MAPKGQALRLQGDEALIAGPRRPLVHALAEAVKDNFARLQLLTASREAAKEDPAIRITANAAPDQNDRTLTLALRVPAPRPILLLGYREHPLKGRREGGR